MLKMFKLSVLQNIFCNEEKKEEEPSYMQLFRAQHYYVHRSAAHHKIAFPDNDQTYFHPLVFLF